MVYINLLRVYHDVENNEDSLSDYFRDFTYAMLNILKESCYINGNKGDIIKVFDNLIIQPIYNLREIIAVELYNFMKKYFLLLRVKEIEDESLINESFINFTILYRAIEYNIDFLHVFFNEFVASLILFASKVQDFNSFKIRLIDLLSDLKQSISNELLKLEKTGNNSNTNNTYLQEIKEVIVDSSTRFLDTKDVMISKEIIKELRLLNLKIS